MESRLACFSVLVLLAALAGCGTASSTPDGGLAPTTPDAAPGATMVTLYSAVPNATVTYQGQTIVLDGTSATFEVRPAFACCGSTLELSRDGKSVSFQVRLQSDYDFLGVPHTTPVERVLLSISRQANGTACQFHHTNLVVGGRVSTGDVAAQPGPCGPWLE